MPPPGLGAAAAQPGAEWLHGELIPDPHRWLEDPDTPQTVAWVDAQNARTEAWLREVPTREAIRNRLTELWDYPRFGVPFRRGSRWFQFRNPGLANQPILYCMDGPDEQGRPLLDPNCLAEDGTVAVTAASVSEDGTWLAYATSSDGSDWQTWKVRAVASGEDRPDVLRWSKFGSVAWLHDGSGFTYVGFDPPRPGAEHTDASRCPRVLLHRLGEDQSKDELLFSAPDQPEWLPDAAVTDDGRFLIVTISRGTAPETRVLVGDLRHQAHPLVPLIDDFGAAAKVVTAIGSDLLVLTDDRAGRQRVVSVNLQDPSRERWRELLPESSDMLVAVHHLGGRLVCEYLRDASAALRVYDRGGALLHEIPCPPASTVTAVEGRPGDDCLHFGTTSHTDSGSIWVHDLARADTRRILMGQARVEADAVCTEQVVVNSADGTRIPLFLTHRRDVRPTGEVPVLLYGYGGFGVPITPTFSVAHAVHVERGGLLAVAVLRGGGEYGRHWHDAGRRDRKQNVVDDFIACARWLGEEGWSQRDRIAITGASNGGLLVGACLTQRPDLIGAAVAEVGVLDLLRFHRFTIGWAWTSDFGNPDDPQEFPWIRQLSPLHRVVSGTRYPATLLMTGDHDDRVVPAHSYKFAAALQAAQAGSAPILVRVEASGGHGLGTPTRKLIAARADLLAFVERALGVAAPRAASSTAHSRPAPTAPGAA